MKELDQFTVERLTELSKAENLPEVAALARIALEAKTSQPVQWWTGPEPTPTGEMESCHDHETGSHYIPLIPMLGAANSPELQDGWVMVPVEPTNLMLAAAKEWTGLTETAKVLYREMLAAAPKPEK
ncbi:TPA: hypothetical protein ACG0BA_002210 [Serratia odorifera]